MVLGIKFLKDNPGLSINIVMWSKISDVYMYLSVVILFKKKKVL